jgi:TetR/AcrR family transcriptional repressor of nem operon
VRENKQPQLPRPGAREKLLDAAFVLIREQGYSATSVDELCAQAGVTKGAFFHHFQSKAALAVAAANRWSEVSTTFFQTAPYHEHRDPLDRVLGYLDFRKALLKGEVAEFTCLAGTMVQEVYRTHAEIREACEASISGQAATIAADIAEAMKLYGVRAKWSAQSLALHTQAVLQGAFILAKAKGGPEVAAASVDHLRRYIELLFETGAGRKRRLARPRASSGYLARSSSTRRASASVEDANLPGETSYGG